MPLPGRYLVNGEARPREEHHATRQAAGDATARVDDHEPNPRRPAPTLATAPRAATGGGAGAPGGGSPPPTRRPGGSSALTLAPPPGGRVSQTPWRDTSRGHGPTPARPPFQAGRRKAAQGSRR